MHQPTGLTNGILQPPRGGRRTTPEYPQNLSKSSLRLLRLSSSLVENAPADLEPISGIAQLTAAHSSLRTSRDFTKFQLSVFTRARDTHSVEVENVIAEIIHRNQSTIDPVDQVALRFAARNHDIGHFPCSHTFEPELELIGEMDHDERGILWLASEENKVKHCENIKALYGSEIEKFQKHGVEIAPEMVLDRAVAILREDSERQHSLGHAVRELADRVAYVEQDILVTGATELVVKRVIDACNYVKAFTKVDESGMVFIDYPGTQRDYVNTLNSLKNDNGKSLRDDLPAIFYVQEGRRLIHQLLNEHPRVACTSRVLRTLLKMALHGNQESKLDDVATQKSFLTNFLNLKDGSALQMLRSSVPTGCKFLLQELVDGGIAPDLHYSTPLWSTLANFKTPLLQGSKKMDRGKAAAEAFLQDNLLKIYYRIPEAQKYAPPIVAVTSDYGKDQSFMLRGKDGVKFLARTLSETRDERRIVALHLPKDLPDELQHRYVRRFTRLLKPLIGDNDFNFNEVLDSVHNDDLRLLLELASPR